MTEVIRLYLDIYCKEVLLYIKARVGLSVAPLEWNNVGGGGGVPFTFIFLLHVLIEIINTEETYLAQKSVSVFEVCIIRIRRFCFVS
jgi:hypothetical protein